MIREPNSQITQPRADTNRPTADAKETPEQPTSGPYTMSDDDIRCLGIGKWRPSDKQITWFRGYVSSGPKASRRAIAVSIGIPEETIRGWYRRSTAFNRWMHDATVEYYTACNVPGIWRMMAEQAIKGDRMCAVEVLLRADPAYRAAKHKQPVVGPKPIADPDIARIAAEAQAEPADDGRVTSACTKQGTDAAE